MISGDSHHYARYRSDTGREKITAGGRGAFLSATHALEAEVDVPTAPDGDLSRHCSSGATPMRRRRDGSAGGRWHCRSGTRRSCGFPGSSRYCCSWPTSSAPERAARIIGLRGRRQQLVVARSRTGTLAQPVDARCHPHVVRADDGVHQTAGSIRVRWAKLGARAGDGRVPHHPPARHGGDGRLGGDSPSSTSRMVPRTLSWWSCSSRSWGPCAARRARSVPRPRARLFGTHQTEVFSAIREGGLQELPPRPHRPRRTLTVYSLGIDRVVKHWDLDPDNPDNEASYLKPRGDMSIDVRLIDQTSFDGSSA